MPSPLFGWASQGQVTRVPGPGSEPFFTQTVPGEGEGASKTKTIRPLFGVLSSSIESFPQSRGFNKLAPGVTWKILNVPSLGLRTA